MTETMPESFERVAKAFHEAYEELAPNFGYKTREASAKPWEDVPVDNKELMKATIEKVYLDGHIAIAYTKEQL